MEQTIKTELKKIAERINFLIADDPFPEKIEPECLRSAVRAYPMRGGKRLRPALLLWSCGALGGSTAMAEYAAASVEIYHNWTLVHDDIIDCDEFRRGVATTHTELARHANAAFHTESVEALKFGKDMAILTGDIQHGWAMNMLLRSGEKGVHSELILRLMRRFQESVNRELISGEALDVEFPLRNFQDITRTGIMKMISGKTSALLRFSAQCGGAIALQDAKFAEEPLLNLGNYAEYLGLAFQLRDDYLGVFGEEKEFGKPLCSDFKEAKTTILYLEAHKQLSAAGKGELDAMMGLENYGAAELEKLRFLLLDSGAVEAILRESQELSEKALENLDVLPDTPDKKLLAGFVDYLLERNI